MRLKTFGFLALILFVASPPATGVTTALPAISFGATGAGVSNAFTVQAAVPGPEEDPFDFCLDAYEIPGAELASRQIRRGLTKNLHRKSPRDQSFEGLRDVIMDSSDARIRRMLPVVERLERQMRDGAVSDDSGYTDGLIEDLTPLTVFIQERTGIPASVVMAQIIVESGWGGSNITILKNNVLGIGNARASDRFSVTLDLGDYRREIDVRCPPDTSAFQFQNIADSIFYYVYVLLQSPENEANYCGLRRFLVSHRDMEKTDPEAYRRRIVELIAEGYHHNPDWYVDYIEGMIDRVRPIEKKRLALAD